MKRLRLSAALVAVPVLALSACNIDTTSTNAKSGHPHKTASSSKSASSTSPAIDGPVMHIKCYTADFTSTINFTISRLHPDFSEAWATDTPYDKKTGVATCEDADANEYGEGKLMKPVTKAEQMIWDNNHDGKDRLTLAIPYEQCVDHDTPFVKNEWPSGGGQGDEARRMLMLCPNHPNAAVIAKRIGIQDGFQNQILNHETLTDGIWRIGVDRKAGTYRTTEGGGSGLTCYWARHDSSGRAIQSDVVDKAKTITVTIAPSDFSFYTENCGVWFRIG